jgi:hypothetical protein
VGSCDFRKLVAKRAMYSLIHKERDIYHTVGKKKSMKSLNINATLLLLLLALGDN